MTEGLSTEPLAALVRELDLVRRRGVTGLGANPLSESAISMLLSTARKIASEKEGTSQRKLITKLMRTALPEITPQDRHAAEILFGLAEGTAALSPKERRIRAAAIVGYSVHTVRKPGHYEDQLLERVAEEINRIAVSSTTRFSEITPTTPYIQRPSLSEALAAAAEKANPNSPRIFIAGAAGTGKTRFIKEKVRNSEALAVVWLDAATDDTLCASITHTLESSGTHTAGPNIVALKQELIRFLHERGKIVVVIDNFDDPDRIDQLIPANLPCLYCYLPSPAE